MIQDSNISVNNSTSITNEQTYPSNTALPNGLVEDDPPKNKSHICVANCCACASDVNVAAPVAPPRL